MLSEFSVQSAPGNERAAIDQVVAAVEGMPISPARLERLKTATGEATMNAMEHGNRYDPGRPVEIVVSASEAALCVRITDQGGDHQFEAPGAPDLEAKLDGLQSPRGWGMFLIQNMVDEARNSHDGHHHSLELILRLRGDDDDVQA